MDEEAVADGAFADNGTCIYWGTDYIEGKIWLIGMFGTTVALTSIILNFFLCIVYLYTPSLAKSAVLYFGVIAVVDIIMGFNYIAAMSVPVFIDYYGLLWLYHVFVSCVVAVVCESNCALFSSSLLILLATTERLLRTFQVKTTTHLRRFVEKNRVGLCAGCILVAVAYKLPTYFELDVTEHLHCGVEEFSRFEIVATPLVRNEIYRKLFMFWTRFIVDRISPFILLVLMNFKIITALKQQTFTPKKTVFMPSSSTKCSRRNIRDATRTLIIMVSLYIVSQAPQMIISISEFSTPNLDEKLRDDEGLHQLYSYANDICSICSLLSSCLRFPVYLANNRQINDASRATFRYFCGYWRAEKKPKDYRPISAPTASLTAGKAPSKKTSGGPRGVKLAEDPLNPDAPESMANKPTDVENTDSTSNYSATYEYHLNEYRL
ncbi:unnamed protein product, partial [Mesorhabditis spiculigera]